MVDIVCLPGRRFAILIVSLAIYTVAMILPGWAADASGWDGDQRSAVRLVAASALDASGRRMLRSGIEVRLAPGWKMYWRYPGDAGVPPRFDFTGSENIKTITVLWPAPQRFSADGINYIAYKDHVILPLHIVPQDERKGVTVRVKVDYGIYEQLCILAEAQIELLLSGTASSLESVLTAAEARVPKLVAIGEGETLAIRGVRREVGSTSPRMVVDVAAPAPSSVDLFVEGPTPDWALPQPIAAAGELRRFAFDISGIPPGAKPEGSQLKFTAVAGDQAIEVQVRLD